MHKNKQETADENPINGGQQAATPRRSRKRADAGQTLVRGKRTARGSVTVTALRGPTAEEIAVRAYYLSEDRLRRGESGSAERDWFEAERSLLGEGKA
jgi:hypothetical protein